MDPQEKQAKELERKKYERYLEEHRGRARLARRAYHRRRNKACKEENLKRGYLSMVIDGAGAQASNYSPRYNTTEKGEPARHKMLKIKSTYIKVHNRIFNCNILLNRAIVC